MRALKAILRSERGQGGIEYLLLIAALIGLGAMIAYYWWTSAKSAASSASGATGAAASSASQKGSQMASEYTSSIS
ncbi:class III signal peptide-containing protein [Methanopyrus sp.]